MTDHPVDDGVPADGGLPALDAVEARLRATLSHHAGTITVADTPFDPGVPPAIDLEPEHDGEIHALTGAAWRRIKAERRARRGRVIWIAAATAAAILVGLLVVTRRTAGPEVKVGASTSVVAPPTAVVPVGGPDAALVPTWTPDGMQLWSISAGGPDGTRNTVARSSTQLLIATAGDGAMLVQLTADSSSTSSTGGAPPSTTAGSTPSGSMATSDVSLPVRGTTGRARAGTDGPTGPIRTIDWTERGAQVTAAVRSLTDDQAVAVLDTLVLRDGSDPLRGFAAPALAGWTLGGEHLSDAPTPADSLAVTLTYGPTAPTGNDPVPLAVTTYGAGDHFPGYLRTQLYGARRPDGVAATSTTLSTSSRGEPAYTMVWPDGRTVIVETADALDEAVAERVALSVEPITLAELRERQIAVSARLGQGPLLASVDLPSARLELIGTTEPTAICLTVPTGERSCTSRDLITYWRPTPVLGSTIVAGSWWVFAAGHDRVELRASSPTNVAPAANAGTSTSSAATGSVPRLPRPTPAETATDGAWTFSLLPLTADTSEVSVDLDTHGLNLSRPLV